MDTATQSTSSAKSPDGPTYGGQIVQEDPREAEFKRLIQQWIDGDVDNETVRNNVPEYYLSEPPRKSRIWQTLITWLRSGK